LILYRDNFMSPEAQQKYATMRLLPQVSWKVWIIALVILVLGAVLEAAYRAQRKSVATPPIVAPAQLEIREYPKPIIETGVPESLVAGKLGPLPSRQESPVGSSEWKALAESFKEYTKSGTVANWQHSSLQNHERWDICADTRYATRQCESLCRLAGAMLARSPRVTADLPMEVASRSDPVARWLGFLKENYNAMEHVGHAVEPVGDKQNSILLGTIRELAPLSVSACIDSAAREIG